MVGPSTAKLEFIKYLHSHVAELIPQIVGVETVDHPERWSVVAYAKKYFKAHDDVASARARAGMIPNALRAGAFFGSSRAGAAASASTAIDGGGCGGILGCGRVVPAAAWALAATRFDC